MGSDGISWEVCPVCGRTAAVGWVNNSPAEFDCTAGCLPSTTQMRRLAELRDSDLDRQRPW